MVKIVSRIEQVPTSQSLCELALWEPVQGSLPEGLPISVDLDLYTENVHLPDVTYQIIARRVTIQLKLKDADIIRGSRLGEFVHDPDLTAEVTQCIRIACDSEMETSGKIDVVVQPNFLGKLIAVVSWKKKRSQQKQHDHVMKSVSRVARVIPRQQNKWDIVEPVSPFFLNGRYLGQAGDKDIGPLCLITMRKKACAVEVLVIVDVNDIDIHNLKIYQKKIPSLNKRLIIDQFLRRSMDLVQSANLISPAEKGPNAFVTCISRMELKIEDQ